MATPNIVFSSLSVVADGVTAISVTGIPLESDVTIRFDGATETLFSLRGIAEEEVDLTFSEPGPYEVEVYMKDVTTDEGVTYGHYVVVTPVEAT